MAIVITVKWRVRSGEEDAVAEALASHIPTARREPGLLLLEAHRDPADPQVFYFYEQYVDGAALAAHAETEHFERYVRAVCLPRLESSEKHQYVTWEPQ